MSLDFHTLTQLRKNHPAWRLLQADHAPLIASFLDSAFIQTNERVMPQAQLIARLEDVLFQLREEDTNIKFPRSAQAYLDEWAQNEKGWLRKFYPQNTDEPHFDLTPATEKALVWLEGLAERRFVGTESRLLMVFELLRQMVDGVESNADIRIAELEKRKKDIDKEIASIQAGDIRLMDDSALKDRFLQISTTARELLSDFRAVEHNFRELDRDVREKIATWDGQKGQLLGKILGERDAITDSDQGRSFRAFWDFLMSPASQEELTALLDQVFEMDSLSDLTGDRRLKRIHFDWLEAGEFTQRTVAKLSQQLRRYLDDQTYLENKRIMQLLDSINIKALAIKNQLPQGAFMTLHDYMPSINLLMDRPLFRPPIKAVIQDNVLAVGGDDAMPDALFNQTIINKDQLLMNIERAKGIQSQITLTRVIEQYPLQHGLAELIIYLSLAAEDKMAIFDDTRDDIIYWTTNEGINSQATLPRIIFN